MQGDATKYGHDGTDAMIITVPPHWYAQVEGRPVLLARAAGAGLRRGIGAGRGAG